MTLLEACAILLAGLAAGTINTVVGSGTLITFPTLLAFGVPPVTANVSNTIGWSRARCPGRRLPPRAGRAAAAVLRLGVASLVGGLAGAVLLLVLPAEAFAAIVPALVALGSCWWSSSRGSAAGSRPGTTAAGRRARSTAPGGLAGRCCWPACTAATSAPRRACC